MSCPGASVCQLPRVGGWSMPRRLGSGPRISGSGGREACRCDYGKGVALNLTTRESDRALSRPGPSASKSWWMRFAPGNEHRCWSSGSSRRGRPDATAPGRRRRPFNDRACRRDQSRPAPGSNAHIDDRPQPTDARSPYPGTRVRTGSVPRRSRPDPPNTHRRVGGTTTDGPTRSISTWPRNG